MNVQLHNLTTTTHDNGPIDAFLQTEYLFLPFWIENVGLVRYLDMYLLPPMILSNRNLIV
jgi:hypothetical protein